MSVPFVFSFQILFWISSFCIIASLGKSSAHTDSSVFLLTYHVSFPSVFSSQILGCIDSRDSPTDAIANWISVLFEREPSNFCIIASSGKLSAHTDSCVPLLTYHVSFSSLFSSQISGCIDSRNSPTDGIAGSSNIGWDIWISDLFEREPSNFCIIASSGKLSAHTDSCVPLLTYHVSFSSLFSSQILFWISSFCIIAPSGKSSAHFDSCVSWLTYQVSFSSLFSSQILGWPPRIRSFIFKLSSYDLSANFAIWFNRSLYNLYFLSNSNNWEYIKLISSLDILDVKRVLNICIVLIISVNSVVNWFNSSNTLLCLSGRPNIIFCLFFICSTNWRYFSVNSFILSITFSLEDPPDWINLLFFLIR